MTAGFVAFGILYEADKRILTRALPAGLVIGILFGLACVKLAAQNEIETYRIEAVRRLQAEIVGIEAQPVNVLVLAGLSRAKFFLAGVTTDRNRALTLYRSGLSDANRAMKLQENNPAARLWGVVNTLRIFKIEKPFKALWTMDDLEADLLELKRSDEKFEYAAPDRVLAVMYAESPGWLIGSSTKAERHFKAALKIAPEFPANSLLYADFLLDHGRVNEARSLIFEVAAGNKMSDFPLYEMIWRMDLAKIRQRLAE